LILLFVFYIFFKEIQVFKKCNPIMEKKNWKLTKQPREKDQGEDLKREEKKRKLESNKQIGNKRFERRIFFF